jgi:DNA replication protein DnaC
VLDPLDAMLTRLQLPGIRDQLDNLLDEAARANLSARETLALLLEREIARKDHRRIDMALKLAHFPAVKDLASFDYDAQPSVDPKQIRDLAAGRWIANGENLLLLGPPGVGKTHLAPGSPNGLALGVVAIALGREAILAGYAVQFVTAMTLVASLAKTRAERRLEERLTNLAKPRLLIVDELGYLPLEPDAAHLLFQLVSRRYEKGAMLITSNRTISACRGLLTAPLSGAGAKACWPLPGNGLRRRRGGDGDPRPAPPPQPRRHHPRRQLPPQRQAAEWGC